MSGVNGPVTPAVLDAIPIRGLSVMVTLDEPCKDGRTDQNTTWGADSGLRNHELDGGAYGLHLVNTIKRRARRQCRLLLPASRLLLL